MNSKLSLHLTKNWLSCSSKLIANHTHVNKVGTTQNFCLAFIDELGKQLFIKKTVKKSGPIKNVRILIFTMLHFL